MIVLMSRWPVLERGIGADRLARWHGRGGKTVLSLVLIHAVAAVAGWSGAQGLSPWAALVQVLGMPGLVAATIGTVILCVVAGVSIQVARTRLSYERWHTVHLLTYVAVALSFLHQLAGPDLAGHVVLQVLWSLMYVHAFTLVLRHRALAPLRAAARHQLRVSQVVQEAPGVVSIVLSGNHLDELAAEPGQFFRWRFMARHTWATAHPFSLSAPAKADKLRLTVKALGNGSSLLQKVPIGTRVIAEGPYGAMTADRRTHPHVLLIAGGVGITPMRALFETIPADQDQDLVLLYRARSREEIVFRYELDLLAARRRARVIYLLGDDPGLLSPDTIRRFVPDVAERDVYLCGPPGMSGAVRASLHRLRLPRQQLHEERFTF
jgi:predicted ferric reductase